MDKKSNALSRKTVLGFIELIIILGLCLFAPAWSFNYWQAWIYLFIFAASAALITVYLWKKDPQKLLEEIEDIRGVNHFPP